MDIKKEVGRTDTYSNASSEPVPLLFAVNNTQNTLHHLKKEKEKKSMFVKDERNDGREREKEKKEG